MPRIRDISDIPTPKVPLMRGDHVAREWIMFFQAIKDAFIDLESGQEGWWKHFLMMGV